MLESRRGELFPGGGALRPSKLFLEQRKQTLHPSRHGLLCREQASHGPLKQPIGETDIAFGKNISGSLVRQQPYAETLSPIFFNLRNIGAAINQKARKIVRGHPTHPAGSAV